MFSLLTFILGIKTIFYTFTSLPFNKFPKPKSHKNQACKPNNNYYIEGCL